ncbi:2-C-methyl-D-erythritol 2,4-cyclodiphosphate synthase [bacterium]|nr:2-C-methyl-D-erythritol 2,4-cyclodiphosphate synthase [candidate division CSSED10-310 bacterium]
MTHGVRVGIGYDAHCLVRDRNLILGGVTIPFEKGLMGHSDADVLLHAIADAVLGALGRGDIGRYFPETDPRIKDMSSLDILKYVGGLTESAGGRIEWVDAVVIAQRPRLAPHMETMKDNIATALGIGRDMINLKATTTEGMGFPGREEGIAAEAVATLVFDSSGGDE